jgi:hypothetical protein
MKGLFAPLIHQATVYAGAQHLAAPSFVVGDRITVGARKKNLQETDSYVFHSPSGVDERIVPRYVAASATATFESARTTETGVYELHRAEPSQRAKGSLLQAAAVNLSTAESDLRPVTDEELAAFWAKTGVDPTQVHSIAAGGDIGTSVEESRYGVELWRYCVALALILALAEMAIGRELKSQGVESAANSST